MPHTPRDQTLCDSDLRRRKVPAHTTCCTPRSEDWQSLPGCEHERPGRRLWPSGSASHREGNGGQATNNDVRHTQLPCARNSREGQGTQREGGSLVYRCHHVHTRRWKGSFPREQQGGNLQEAQAGRIQVAGAQRHSQRHFNRFEEYRRFITGSGRGEARARRHHQPAIFPNGLRTSPHPRCFSREDPPMDRGFTT